MIVEVSSKFFVSMFIWIFLKHVLGLRLGKIRMRDSRTQEPEQDMNYSNAGPQQLIYTPHQRN